MGMLNRKVSLTLIQIISMFACQDMLWASPSDMLGVKAPSFTGILNAPLAKNYFDYNYIARGPSHDLINDNIFDSPKVLGKDPVILVFIDPLSYESNELVETIVKSMFSTRWWWNSSPRPIFIVPEDYQAPTNYTGGAYFPVITDINRKICNSYGVKKIPTLFIIGRDGTVSFVMEGNQLGINTIIELIRREYKYDIDWKTHEITSYFNVSALTRNIKKISVYHYSNIRLVNNLLLWRNSVIMRSDFNNSIQTLLDMHFRLATKDEQLAFVSGLPAEVAAISGDFFVYVESTDDIAGYIKKPLPEEASRKILSTSSSEEGITSYLRTIYHPRSGELESLIIKFDINGDLIGINRTALGTTISNPYDRQITISFYGGIAHDASKSSGNSAIEGAKLLLYEIRAENLSLQKFDPPLTIGISNKDGYFIGDELGYNYKARYGDKLTFILGSIRDGYRTTTFHTDINIIDNPLLSDHYSAFYEFDSSIRCIMMSPIQ